MNIFTSFIAHASRVHAKFIPPIRHTPGPLLLLVLCSLGIACSCQPNHNQANNTDTNDTASSQPSFDPKDWPPTWPEDLPTEDLEPVIDCPTERCLVIEEHTTLCSLDPYFADDFPYFADKSTLTLPAGTYPLKDDLSFPDIALEIESPHGGTTLLPEEELRYEIIPKFKFHESIRIHRHPFRSPELRVSKFLLTTNFVELWPQPHFRFGDPQNTFWYFYGIRSVRVQIDEPSSIFPEIDQENDASIRYVPCGFPGEPDDLFVFNFEDGSRLELTVRTIINNLRIGVHAGVLLSAQGNVAGQTIEVDDRNHLAYYGNGSGGIRVYPPQLAIYTGPFDEHPETCGLLLKSNVDPDLGPGVTSDGWAAYYLTCDKKNGKQIPLKSAEIPPKYEQP